jgi:hypothetical protein
MPTALAPDPAAGSDRDQINQNIEAVQGFYSREDQKISRSQRVLERISHFVGTPDFLGFVLLFVAGSAGGRHVPRVTSGTRS